MQSMFQGAKAFNQPIGSWNTSSVSLMNSMFQGASAFNQNIGGWDTAKVNNMTNMFNGATAFNNGGSSSIGNWNTSLVTSLDGVFNGASAFNQPLAGWNTSKVTSMISTFRFATSFDQSLTAWDTHLVTSMNGAFYNATIFNNAGDPGINNWNTSAVTNMANMFQNDQKFNQPIGLWDTSKVTNISSMFQSNNGFNQDISTWNFGSVTAAWAFLFNDTKFSVANYDKLLFSLDAQAVKPSVTFGAQGVSYCMAGSARASLISSDTWTITDAGQKCAAPIVTITAPTKLKNSNITDTTIKVTAPMSIASVNVDASSSAAAGSIVCTPSLPMVNTDPTNVALIETNCTIVITGSGNLVINAKDSTGLTTKVTEPNYIVDTVAPSVPSVHVDTSTGINSPTITFSSSDNIAISHYEIDYKNASGVLTTLNPATSPVQLNLDPNELTTGPDFSHIIVVRAYDTAGNISTTTIKFPPIVNFTTPTTLKNSPINDATVTITSPAGNPLDNITLAPGTTGATLGSCTGAGGDTTSPYNNPVTCQINGVAATGTVTVTARDSVTLATGQNMTSFTIETVPPTISIAAPTKVKNSAITTTTVTVQDNYAVNAANVSISAVNTTGAFSISNVNCTQTNVSRVDCTLQIDGNEGTGDLRVNAADRAGNTEIGTEAGYIIDTTAPTVTINQAVGQADPTGVDSAQFTIVFSEPADGFDASDITLSGTSGSVTDWSTSDNITFTATVTGMTSGDTVTATVSAGAATDAAGNGNAASTSTDNAVTYDATAPTGTVNDKLTNSSSPQITGTVSEATAVVKVTIGGTEYTATNNGDGTWILPAGTISPALVDGLHGVTATFTDTLGNSSSATGSLTVDTTAPTTPLTAPDLQPGSDSGTSNVDNITSVTKPKFDVVCTEIDSVITLYFNGIANGAHTCVGTGSESIVTTSSMSDGSYSVTYTATDKLGNKSAVSPELTVVIDSIAPVVSLTTTKTASTSPELVGTIDDPKAVIKVTIGGNTYTAKNNGDGTWTLPGGTISPKLSEGNYDISVSATDIAGNVASAPGTLKLPVSIDPPVITKLAKMLDLSTNEVEWTISVKNPNTADEALTLTDPIPDSTSFVKGSVTCTVTSSDSTITNCDFDSPTNPTKLNITARLAADETITVIVKSTTALNITTVTNTAYASFAGDSSTNSTASSTATELLKASTVTQSGISQSVGKAIELIKETTQAGVLQDTGTVIVATSGVSVALVIISAIVLKRKKLSQ